MKTPSPLVSAVLAAAVLVAGTGLASTLAGPVVSATWTEPSESLVSFVPLDDDLTEQLATHPNVPVSVVAGEAALADPAVAAVLASLTSSGAGVYSGTIDAADAATLAAASGVKASLSRPASLPESGEAEITASPYTLLEDTATTVAGVDPALAAARTSLGTQGTGQLIAVIDTGVDTKALGLSAKVTKRVDFSVPPTDASCSDRGKLDPTGHGTHVASIAAGSVTTVDKTILGVAPKAKIVDLRVFNCANEASSESIDAALAWVLDNRAAYPVSVVNVSLEIAGGVRDGTDTTSILVNRLVASGVVVAVAAGNRGDGLSTVESPSTAEFATTVGSANVSKYGATLSPFSSQGPTSDNRVGVDLLAAGSSIKAANSTAVSKSRTVTYSGTSMASPYIAGLAALLLEQNPSARPTGTSCELGPSCPAGVVTASMTNGIQDRMVAADWYATGADTASGAGLVSASASLRGTTPAPVHTLDVALNAQSPTNIRIPAHSKSVVASLLTDSPLRVSAFDSADLEFTLVDAEGTTSVPGMPCSLAALDGGSHCSVLATGWTPRFWNFVLPATTKPVWLRLAPNRDGHATVSIPGLTDAPTATSGIFIEDVTIGLDGTATATAGRTETATEATTLSIATSEGLSAPESVELPAGDPGTTVTFTVTQTPGFAPLPPASSGRLLVTSGDLLLSSSVRLSNVATSAGQVTVDGQQIRSGDLVFDGRTHLSSNGTVLGVTAQDALVQTPNTGGGYRPWPFIVEAGTTDAVALPIVRSTPSSFTTGGISGNGRVVLLNQYVQGEAVVGDATQRWAWIVYDRQSATEFEVAKNVSLEPKGVGTDAKLSTSGASVGILTSPFSDTVEKKLVWQGGAGFSESRTLAQFTTSQYVQLMGVSDSHVLVQVWNESYLGWEARAYPVAGGAFITIAKRLLDFDVALSPNGASVGWWSFDNRSLYCYTFATKKRVTVGSKISGFGFLGTTTVADGCASMTKTFTRGSGSSAKSSLERYRPGKKVTVLATSPYEPELFSWIADPAGAQFLTVTGIALEPGDTNGLLDVYRGAVGGGSLKAPKPIIEGTRTSGSTLTAVTGTWGPGPATLTYSWYRKTSTKTTKVGTNAKTYTLTSKDRGAKVYVTVSGTSRGFTKTTVTSATVTIAKN